MTPRLTTRATRFWELNKAGRLLLPNAWDAASARVFEEAGFPAIGTTSAGIAYAEGLQDAEHIRRDAMVSAIARIASAVSIPVTADIEGGYGAGACDVAETVEAVLDAGAVGIISGRERTSCSCRCSSTRASSPALSARWAARSVSWRCRVRRQRAISLQPASQGSASGKWACWQRLAR